MSASPAQGSRTRTSTDEVPPATATEPALDGSSSSGPVCVGPIPIEPGTDSIDVPPMEGCDVGVGEPLDVVLTGVEEDLTLVWAADGTIWLLPAYTFTSDDGGRYSVVAITDDLLVHGSATAGDDAGTSEPGTDDGGTTMPEAITQEQADTLVGTSEAEATAEATANGWGVRVVERDGRSLPATMDYRIDRVNLTVVDDVVTAVSVG